MRARPSRSSIFGLPAEQRPGPGDVGPAPGRVADRQRLEHDLGARAGDLAHDVGQLEHRELDRVADVHRIARRRSRTARGCRAPRRRRSRTTASASPVPYMVSGLPSIACIRKFETTRPSAGRRRGPYVLKMRTIARRQVVQAVVRHRERLREPLRLVVDRARRRSGSTLPLYVSVCGCTSGSP